MRGGESVERKRIGERQGMAETGNAPVQAFGNIARGVDGDGNAAFSCLFLSDPIRD